MSDVPVVPEVKAEPAPSKSGAKASVNSIYHYGRSEDLIPSDCNPVKDVGSSTITDYKPVVLEAADTFAILKELNDPLIWTLVVLLACTALRVSEALGLRWSDLKRKKGKIDIQRGYTASGVRTSPNPSPVETPWRCTSRWKQ